MTVYSVYEPPADEDSDVEERAGKVAFVKDGFSWPALFVPVLWLIYQRMWIELIVFLAVVTAVQWAFGASAQGIEAAGWVTIGLTALFAFEANDLRGWALARRGYSFAAVASGRDRYDAERSFFTAWLPKQDRQTRRTAPAPKTQRATTVPSSAQPRDGDEVIGLFPKA